MRTSMLDVLGQDYIKTAKAKGLSQSGIIFKHAMRNAIMPVVTVLGPITAGILTGGFVVVFRASASISCRAFRVSITP